MLTLDYVLFGADEDQEAAKPVTTRYDEIHIHPGFL